MNNTLTLRERQLAEVREHLRFYHRTVPHGWHEQTAVEYVAEQMLCSQAQAQQLIADADPAARIPEQGWA